MYGFDRTVYLKKFCDAVENVGWEYLAPAVHAMLQKHGKDYTIEDLFALVPSEADVAVPLQTRMEIAKLIIKKLEKPEVKEKERTAWFLPFGSVPGDDTTSSENESGESDSSDENEESDISDEDDGSGSEINSEDDMDIGSGIPI